MQYVYSQHRNELYGETIKYQAARENIYDDETDTHTQRERETVVFLFNSINVVACVSVYIVQNDLLLIFIPVSFFLQHQ